MNEIERETVERQIAVLLAKTSFGERIFALAVVVGMTARKHVKALLEG